MNIAATLAATTRKLLVRAIRLHEEALFATVRKANRAADAAYQHETEMIDLSRRVNEQKRAAAQARVEAYRHAWAVEDAVYSERQALPYTSTK